VRWIARQERNLLLLSVLLLVKNADVALHHVLLYQVARVELMQDMHEDQKCPMPGATLDRQSQSSKDEVDVQEDETVDARLG
jgi:hypothetical protein